MISKSQKCIALRNKEVYFNSLRKEAVVVFKLPKEEYLAF